MARPTSVILDDDVSPSYTGQSLETARHGFEYGLAAALIGATFLVMGPVAVIFSLVFWNGGSLNHGLNHSEVLWTEIASIICAAGAELLCTIGVIFGLRGLNKARQARQPTALPVTGMLLCIAAMVMWLIVGIDLVMMFEYFLSWHGR
jgi:hypothetical protein